MTSPEAVPFPPRPKELPTEIVLSADSISIRVTPNEQRTIEEATGKGVQELLSGEAKGSERDQTVVWIKLRREGFDPTWEQAGDVIVDYRAPDPTSGGSSTSSPPSADSGP